MILDIDLKKKESENKKAYIKQKEVTIKKEKNEIVKLTKEEAKKLEEALPILKEAESKIATLDNSSMAEIKATKNTKNKTL